MDINILTLAYLGDSVYETFVRTHFVYNNIIKVKELQKIVTKYVSAKGQAKSLQNMIDSNFFKEDEIEVMKRARNHKVSHSPKNTDIITYKHATAFEAILGYLYTKKNIERLEEIMERSLMND